MSTTDSVCSDQQTDQFLVVSKRKITSETMSKTSLALFLFSLLSVLCVSVGHTVVKRKAPDGQLYEFAKVDKCVSVESEETCPVSWPLNDFYSKLYKHQNGIVKSVVESYWTVGYPEQCPEAIRKILCSQVIPRCSSKGVDFGDALKTCRNIDNSCSLRKGRFPCDNWLTGAVTFPQCVAVTTPIRGVCPQPRFKVPSLLLSFYRKRSERLSQTFTKLENLKLDNGTRAFSNGCLSQLKEISCSAFYCSADEEAFLVKHDQEDCNKTVKECFDDVMPKISLNASHRKDLDIFRTTLQCDVFPNASTAHLQAEYPTNAIPIQTSGTTSATKCVQFPYFISLLSAVVSLLSFEDM